MYATLVSAPFGHEHVRELAAVRAILDARPEFARWVQTDLLAGGIATDRGRSGLSGEQVLRALVIKQANEFSYEELAFHLADSQSYRAFLLDRLRGAAAVRRNQRAMLAASRGEAATT